MNFPSLCSLLLTVPLTADVPEAMVEWQQRHADVTSVDGELLVIEYDLAFCDQREGTGAFAYHGPEHGFWRVTNNPDPAHPLRESHGRAYRRKPLRNEHWWQSDGRILDIDDEAREVRSADLPPHTAVHRIPLLGLSFSFTPATFLDPTHFLPGCPQKAVTLDWDFSVVKETESLVAITATPKPNSALRQRFSHCDLMFLGDPIRLAAVRVKDHAHTRETVYYFSHVDFAPAVTPEPDLEGYKIQQILSAAARGN